MQLPPDRENLFRNQPDPIITPARVLILLLIFGAMTVLFMIAQGDIERITLVTPTATRSAHSFILEGEALFESGDLSLAVSRYEEALTVDPTNTAALVQLARLQVYYAALLTRQEAFLILADARENIDLAVSLDDFNSDVHAIRTLVYDWSASYAHEDPELYEEYLSIASQAGVRAVLLDTENYLAYTFRAEIMADQIFFTQANDLIGRALELESDSMDVHRVYAGVLESQGQYSAAIEEYKLAAEYAPNYTYLYIKIGQNYRELQLYDQALSYFAQAANINKTLDIEDPVPYIGIAKTYVQLGEFFVAARNAETALSFDPLNTNTYGELGLIRWRARNFEGAVPVLRCATIGCTAEENAEDEGIAVPGAEMTNSTVAYYYVLGSILAALDRCDEAEPILIDVQANYSADPLISGIVQESLFVCEILSSGESVPTSTPPATEEMQMDDGG